MAGAEAAAAKAKSDLPVRAASAVVMLAVAGAALWLGGWPWAVFVGLVAAGVLWEWRSLVRGFAGPGAARMAWNLAGFLYIGLGAVVLLVLRSEFFGVGPVLALLGAVIATDVGAYFAGRAIGGPRIAPRISPSKTWAGLGGGVAGASLALLGYLHWAATCDASLGGLCGRRAFPDLLLQAVLAGAAIAVIAQAGDFFESWMKRRAGVKDSGRLLPGHGGLFDRADGLLAVCFACGLLSLPRLFPG